MAVRNFEYPKVQRRGYCGSMPGRFLTVSLPTVTGRCHIAHYLRLGVMRLHKGRAINRLEDILTVIISGPSFL